MRVSYIVHRSQACKRYFYLTFLYYLVTTVCGSNEYFECLEISGHPQNSPVSCVSPFSHGASAKNGTIYSHLTVSIESRIKRIEYFARATGKLFISFWRPAVEAIAVEMVGKVEIVAPSQGFQVVEIPETSRFDVMYGDMLGHHLEDESEGSLLCVGNDKELFRTGHIFDLSHVKHNANAFIPGYQVDEVKVDKQLSPGIKAVFECRCPENCGSNICDELTGKCESCKAGWSGDKCNKMCKAHFYGVKCKEKCSSGCKNDMCDTSTGVCTQGCKNGYLNENCEEQCEDGFYGKNCHELCGKCRNNEPCSKDYGFCPTGCEDGYQAPLCHDTCKVGTYGYNCANLCGKCYEKADCRASDGVCTNGCQLGFLGSHCWVATMDTACKPDVLDRLKSADSPTLSDNNITEPVEMHPRSRKKMLRKLAVDHYNKATALHPSQICYLPGFLVMTLLFFKRQ